MKKAFICFIFFLLLASYSCLDTPNMNGEIPNMRDKPTVTSKADMVFNQEHFSLIITGEILSYGKSSSFFRQGFYWGIDSTNWTDTIFVDKNMNVEIDIFSHELEKLNGNQIYCWQAVAENQYGIALGEILKFKMPPEEPSVVTGDLSASPAGGELLFKGEISSVGKASSFFEKGFCWGVSENNLTDTILIEDDDFKPGDFFYTLLNARGSTTYYYRAFAKNDYGTGLGDVMEYETPAIFETETAYTFTGQIRSNFTSFTLKKGLYITCGAKVNPGTGNPFHANVWRYDGNRWWGNVDDLPGPARQGAIAFTINDSLAYAGFGQDRTYTYGDLYVFNGNTSYWASVPIAAPSGRYDAVAFSLNNKGYIVGGRNASGILNEVQEFTFGNMLGGTWREKNRFPKPFAGGICFFNKQRVFAGFGFSSETVNTLWEYDAVHDAWNEFASSPTYRQGGSIRSGVVVGDKIYLLDMTNGISSIWELDLATKEYTQKSTLPDAFPVGSKQYIFSIEDVIYVGLGETNLFYRYYPAWDN